MMPEPSPVPVDDAAESALLAAGSSAGPALAEAVAARLRALERGGLNVRAAKANHLDWIGLAKNPGAELARLRAMQAALEAAGPGRPVAYRSPGVADVRAAAGQLVAKAALDAGFTLRELVAAARARRHQLGDAPAAPEAESLAAAAAAFARSGATAEAHQDAHRRLAGAADARAERAALATLDAALESALAQKVAAAIDAAGGPAAVARDYAERLRLAPPPSASASGPAPARAPDPPDLDLAERAQVEAELHRAGATATSPDPGRSVAALQTRHAELTEAIARRRLDEAERTEGAAARIVAGAMAGKLADFDRLAAAAAASPRAFAPGFSAALAQVPLGILDELPCGGFADVLL
jgi:hypothetical protein